MPEFAAVSEKGVLLAHCIEEQEKSARLVLHLMLAEDDAFAPIFNLWEKNDFRIIQLQEG